ncbi:NACHT domain-containing protein [Mesobacillus jeotgali]|uniref:NACHT domain-containing protein n=1 Tax=Mesobacillus jeotgali TaxID=129985 RepID=UPI001CFEBBDD|nr:ATP-binding protein [Mesobacillus jeotgali]
MAMKLITLKLIDTIFGELSKHMGFKIIEKIKLKRKLKKINSFKREYDDTQIDTYTFQEFLNLDKTQYLIFDFLFSSKFQTTSKQDMVQSLIYMAREYINSIYNKHGRANFTNEAILEDYFNYLIEELIKFRDQDLNESQRTVVATVQNSIMESNSNLKEYIDSKFYEIENYSLAKQLTDKRIDELLKHSIDSLGVRYNPKANVETISREVFKSLFFEDEIKVFFKEKQLELLPKFDAFFRGFEQVKNNELDKFNRDRDFIKNINSNKETIENFNSFNEKMYLDENFSPIVNAYKDLNDSLYDFEYNFRKLPDNNVNAFIYKVVKSLLNSIDEIYNYILELEPQLINSPYLVINGEGGIGKSHLIADIAEEKRKQGHIVFLFLGQHFTSQRPPFEQMFAFLEYKGDSENFLSEINVRAIRSNKKAIIFIDALNEGQGKYFWKNFIVDFIAKIKKYPNIILVMSIRTNFMRSVFPDTFFKDNKVTLFEHKGFLNLTLEELRPFLNYYKVNPLVIPTLQSECRNPLFLKMYCEVASGSDFNPSLGWSITEVLSLYIKKVNYNLSNDPRFPFVGHINLVRETLEGIANKMMVTNLNFLSISEAQEIITKIAQKHTEGYRIFLDGLLEENILSLSKGYQGDENVYFNYERFGDIFISIELVKNTSDLNKIDVNFQPNIFEALSIVAPEMIEKELFEILNNENIEINYYHIESFIRGLSWRKSESINKKTISYIQKGMKEDLELVHLIFEQLLLISYSNNSLLNAEYLHEQLINMSLAERDGKWTTYINEKPELITNILELSTIRDQEFTQPEIADLLIANTITWFLTSSNRLLRDRATHILVNLFKENMELVILLLEKFKNVNDPYVFERLYAAIYGACLRTEQTHLHSDICDFIISEIFSKDEVYPHVLLRDYARGILLYSEYRGFYKVVNIDIINPPYKSKWYDKIPTLDEVDKLKLAYSEKKYGRKSYSIETILNSMTTEYGRDTGGYGDFGRYVFESALSDWSNQFDAQDLSNIATMRVFDLGYDIDLHGEYDLMAGRYYDRFSSKYERIGKKYQWISFHEIIARLSDNFPIYIEEKKYTDEYHLELESYNKRLSNFIEKFHEESNQVTESSYENETFTIPIFNPNKHIKTIKKIERPFRGSWDSYIRDIDTTILINKKPKKEVTLINYEIPNINKREWINKELDITSGVFEIDYESKKYISLGCMYSNKREFGSKYENRDELFIKTKAIFVDNDSEDSFKTKTQQKRGGNGISWRESNQTYAFEHFWHPSYEDYIDEYSVDKQNNYKVYESVWSYLWENNYDYDTGERNSISYLMPDASLVEFFELTQETEGVWIDNRGTIIALDASIFGYETCLLFDKQKLEEYLSDHNLSIFWNGYIEKVSEGYFHEWWLLYQMIDGNITSLILDERDGKLRY